MNFKNISPGRLKLPLVCILITIMILIIGFVFFQNKLDINPLLKDIEIDSSADALLHNFMQTSKTNGIKEWSLKASSAKLIYSENSALLNDVEVIIFTKNNTQGKIFAKKGRLNTSTHDIDLSGKVTLLYEGVILKTDKLHYEKKRHIIYSDGKVNIVKENSTIQADSLFADLKNSTMKLEGNIKGKFIETNNFY